MPYMEMGHNVKGSAGGGRGGGGGGVAAFLDGCSLFLC